MRWTWLPEPSDKQINTLSKKLSVSNVIASLLLQRNIGNYDEAKSFFRPNLANLHDPFLNEGYG